MSQSDRPRIEHNKLVPADADLAPDFVEPSVVWLEEAVIDRIQKQLNLAGIDPLPNDSRSDPLGHSQDQRSTTIREQFDRLRDPDNDAIFQNAHFDRRLRPQIGDIEDISRPLY